MTDDDDNDSKQLRQLAGGLPVVDVDPESAQRIAAATRADIGAGPPRRRIVETVAVAVVTGGTLVWALYMVCEALK